MVCLNKNDVVERKLITIIFVSAVTFCINCFIQINNTSMQLLHEVRSFNANSDMRMSQLKKGCPLAFSLRVHFSSQTLKFILRWSPLFTLFDRVQLHHFNIMHIMNRSNQNNKKRRYSNNCTSLSNVILFHEDELCGHSCTEKEALECGKPIILYHVLDRKSSSSLSPISTSHECGSKYANLIEYDPYEDIYEPLDFKKDWSKDLKKNYEIHMRNICSNLDSNEDHLDRKKFKRS